MDLKSLPIRLRSGLTIHVPDSPDILTTYVLMEQEAWFEEEVEFVTRYMRRGESAVDIGANFGVYTTAIAERVGPAGTVFAFEPASETCALLRTTAAHRHSKTVQVVQAALSDRRGTGDLVIYALPELNALATADTPGGSRESVELTTLDDYLAGWPKKKISFIKLDAEGHELKVLAGAHQVLQRDEPLVMFEINLDGKIDLQSLDALQEIGFTGFRLVPGLNVLVPFARDEPVDFCQLNLFAGSARKARDLEERGLLVQDPTRDPPPLPTQRPATDEIIGAWSSRPTAGSPYETCLAHFACASAAASAAEQIPHLVMALQQANFACNENFTAARVLTFARIAGILGLRNHAVMYMAKIIDSFGSSTLPIFTEPFLRPARSFASLSSKANVGRDLATTVLEAFERTRHFSSFYTGEGALTLLDHLCLRPDCSPEMHRRRLLVRMRNRQPLPPEALPLLREEGPDNLNAWVWKTIR